MSEKEAPFPSLEVSHFCALCDNRRFFLETCSLSVSLPLTVGGCIMQLPEKKMNSRMNLTHLLFNFLWPNTSSYHNELWHSFTTSRLLFAAFVCGPLLYFETIYCSHSRMSSVKNGPFESSAILWAYTSVIQRSWRGVKWNLGKITHCFISCSHLFILHKNHTLFHLMLPSVHIT